MKSEDLLATVFPDQVACLENIVGERQIPDHPLVAQTLHDCLHEAMDVEGLEALLRGLEAGEIRIVARDLTAPSPLAAEILNARPYAFLDDAPLEERRTQAVRAGAGATSEAPTTSASSTPMRSPRCARKRGREARNADELHEALMGLGFIDRRRNRRQCRLAALVDALVASVRRAILLPLPQVPHCGAGWVRGRRAIADR